jgi:iron complex outermembrane receptor protein
VNAYYNIAEDFLSPVTVIGVAGANPVVRRGDTPIDEVQTAPLGGTVATYLNFGRFDTYGADLGVTYQIFEALSTTLNYSYFDITFDEDNLEENDFNNDGVVNQLDHKVNSPNHKGSIAFNYNGDRFFGSTFFRYVEEYDYFSSFQVAAKTQDLVYRGSPVVEDAPGTDSYNYGPLGGFLSVDLGLGYKVTDDLRFSVQATNLFDTEYREFTASPFVGRLLSAGMRVEF